MEDNNNKKNVDGISGVSTAVGATIGMVAGSFIDSELHAAENNTNPANIVTLESEPNTSDEITVTVIPEEAETVQEPAIVQEAETPSHNDNDTEIEVVAYETVTDEYGNEMDVALLSVEDQEVLLFDADKDGLADVMVSDVNGDNVIQEEELYDVTEYGISMEPFESEINNDYTDQTLAYNDDYVNDADVTDFMA